jgi:hypothetical protein
MKREPAEPLRLGYLIKARAVHSMTGETYRCLGLRGPEIVAVSADLDGLDDLVGADTAVVDAGDLTVMPAFADSHEHLIEASRNTLLVPVDKARSVAEFTGMVAAAAQVAAAGKWIVTSIGWHESNLSENRLPTLAELDAVAPDHRCWRAAAGTWRWSIRPRCERRASQRIRPIHWAARSGGWPTAAGTGCWRAEPCTRWRRSRRGQARRNWPPRWAPARRLTRRWGWAPSARQ